ncbi:HdeD family acid-resistance protein [Parasedimentitalea psychrophila]|uniref:DUF308 domain-containing protein n=1 Tax=Parasedimentitalea psychrophila TaxID=2997337 RepID=A0A9Y2L1T9_9RHOB|nr:DUF308 domain-containing protein [Parasedimentitalea psychrophila]WIY26588.1 DUF308 domain-containing protein [Parasedimentitalea psychrophila]
MSDSMKWILLGALSLFFSILVLGNTVIATMAVTTLTGAMLMVAGVFQVIGGFSSTESMASKVFAILMGLLLGFLGTNFLFNPLQGAISLTMLVLILLLSSGVVRLIFAWRMRSTGYFWPMILSGAISVLLAGYIWTNFAAASLTFLGIMLGIELMMNGFSLIVIGLSGRSQRN